MDFNENGLSAREVAKLLEQYGLNVLPEVKSKSLFAVFLSQFTSPLILILIASALIICFMGEFWDASIIFFILLFNAVIGTFQEGKADNALRALKNLAEGSATVLRDGKVTILSDKEIVPGDIILLQEGERVPADARLLSVHALKTDESSLTGESISVEKTTVEPTKSLVIQDRVNMVFKGTVVVGGTGKAIVVATGIRTEIGKISEEVASIETDVPLKRGIEKLSKILLFVILGISVFIMIVGLIRGETFRDMFATVVSLAVSIVPEGLPVVMTLVLASGVWRMAKRNVVVKKLEAVEALGQAKIIAVDKTGTLTENEMVLQKVYVDGKTYEVGGTSYAPEGTFSFDGENINPLNHPDLLFAGRIAAFTAEAKVVYIEDSKSWKIAGDPTEAAMVVFAEKIGFKNASEESEKIFEIPFDYIAKYRLSIRKFEKKNFLSVIGAPEKILEMCARVRREQKSEKLGETERKEMESVFTDLSRQGYRVIALAADPDADETVSHGNFGNTLTFVGFFAMRDPIRKEVRGAVESAQASGIRVVMITGDHKVTAHAIALEAGIEHSENEIITGEDLERLNDEELLVRFKDANVFARVTPDHKMRIIELFRKRGEIVAMTGDGVNDAPSLAAADLGVAMGIKGTEVAKEAADIILLDDNFGSIIGAVEEGRNIYRTIRKVILYLFSSSIAEALVIIGALLIGLPLPILPAQIIWLNFVTDGFLVLALAAEPKEKGLLDKTFKQGKSILDAFSVKRMVFIGIIIAAGTLAAFMYYVDKDLAKALTISLSVLAVFQWFSAWNCKSETESVFSRSFFNNWYLIISTLAVAGLQVFAIYHPFMQKILHTVPLNVFDWVLVISVSATIIVLEEVRKIFRFWK